MAQASEGDRHETEITQRLGNELRLLEPVISEVLQLKSRWNGGDPLLGVAAEPWYGVKDWNCGIRIRADIAQSDSRWRTLIHELIHAHSPGYSQSAYDQLRAWEEAPVEQAQRLIRRNVLGRIGVSVDEAVFVEIEKNWGFNEEVAAMESIRIAAWLEGDALAFYRAVLAERLENRRGYLAGLFQSLPAEARREYLRIFSTASSVITEGSKKRLR